MNIDAILGTPDTYCIYWDLLMRCNFDCSYCFEGAHDNVSKIPQIDTYLAASEKLINKIKTLHPDKKIHIGFSGGEPFLIKGIESLFKFNHELGVKTQTVITNGSAPISVYERCIGFLNTLHISWHFETNKDNHIKEVITSIKSSEMSVLVSILDHIDYQDRVWDAINFCKDAGINFIVPPIKMKDADGGYSTFMKDPVVLENEGVSGHEELPIIMDGKFKYTHAHNITSSKSNNFLGWDCNAGLNCCTVWKNGDITNAICKEGGVIGNVYDEYDLPTTPLKCSRTGCWCAADVGITKTSPSNSKYLDAGLAIQIIDANK